MIEIDGLSRRFGDVLAVDDVSMTIERGSITALVGASGSGKSTLLRMINRLIEPTAGTVRIDGRDTATVPHETLRRGMGYVIQGNGLFPHWTVAQNIATVPRLVGWPKARIAARVDALLDLFGLDPAAYRDKYPAQLSGGQQQRVGVARALAAEPAVMLMDEPFGALDPIIRAQAQRDLGAIQRRLGTTIVLVTHDMEEAIRLADRIAVMRAGRLLQDATPAALLADPAPGYVAELVGASDRAFRLLSLRPAAELAEPGTADGPPLDADVSQREALGALLSRGADAVPLAGPEPRIVTLAALRRRAEVPS
ncbi:ABC transporter ATP-binding protein [Prosthecomicrobium pneumaticum]|uniref:Osmoprotectant transport system ATP-binding protein n=1 Tax=Prosthecomicrobium pneumaticum TaxID=81895 RepID=A0A7W9FNL3_9HYPH|nr:ABC transporter ATP-binding protein [Prosthecomicrobium pneumaticum]MBB5753931.1 osmoprotectant transport system ATP-binding protein [Prosthecomicrobium pneumaticum]